MADGADHVDAPGPAGGGLKSTHETIANHLGTHREVITRMLRYLQSEGAVRLRRGSVELTDVKKLREIAG